MSASFYEYCFAWYTYHDDFNGDGNWKLFLKSFIELFHKEHNYHHHKSRHQIVFVCRSYLPKGFLQDLELTQ